MVRCLRLLELGVTGAADRVRDGELIEAIKKPVSDHGLLVRLEVSVGKVAGEITGRCASRELIFFPANLD
jgi:hypothetical protein